MNRWAVALCLLVALWAGLWMRVMAWSVTPTIRFGPDLDFAYHWGTRAHEWGGVLRVYDEEQARNPTQRLLDYPPLRLLVVTRWAEGVRRAHPSGDPETWTRGIVKPLLRLNVAAELATALGLFLLVRSWLGRGQLAPSPSAGPLERGPAPRAGPVARLAPAIGWAGLHRPTKLGLAAALLFWFNPAVILDAHVFPQWDVWLLPFYVFGVLLATYGWWFSAGVLIAVGSMLKGQLLLVAPIFLLWPLFAGQWGAMARWLGGLTAGGAVVAAPWLLVSWAGALWAAGVVVAVGLARAWTGRRARRGYRLGAIALLLGATLYPWLLVLDRAGNGLALALVGALVIATALVPTGQTRYLVAFALAATVGISGVAFGGSFGWYRMGFMNQATRSYEFFSDVGDPGRILHDVFSLPAETPLLGPLLPGSALAAPIGRPFTLGHGFVLAYLVGLVVCAWATARHARRRDPRFLLAVAVPWVLLFTLLPNVRTRYLVWGAGLTAVGPAVGWGATLLHVVVTLSACDNLLRTLLPRAVPPLAPNLLAVLQAAHPHGGWIVLASSVALLWITMRASATPSGESDPDGTGPA